MSETIKSIAGGKDHILALWEGTTDSELYSIAKAAGRELENTALRINRIVNDDRRSEIAKRDDRKEAGLDSLNALSKMIGQLQVAQNKHLARANNLSAVASYRDGDTSTVAIDLEIGRRLSQMPNEQQRMIMLVSGENPRIVDAVLRLPAFLSGLSDAEYRRVYTAAINRKNPEEFDSIQQEADDIEVATGAVKKAFKVIVEQTGADLVAQVKATGGHAEELINASPALIQSFQKNASTS